MMLGKAKSMDPTQKIPTLSLLCNLCSCRCPKGTPGYLQNNYGAAITSFTAILLSCPSLHFGGAAIQKLKKSEWQTHQT